MSFLGFSFDVHVRSRCILGVWATKLVLRCGGHNTVSVSDGELSIELSEELFRLEFDLN